MNDIDIIEDIQKEQQEASEKRTMNFMWDHRGAIMIITCIIMIAGIIYICYNLDFIKQNPLQYCKKMFIDNGCQYACDSILVFGNESELYNPLHAGQIEVNWNESGRNTTSP